MSRYSRNAGLGVDGQRVHLPPPSAVAILRLLVGQRRHVEQLRNALAAFDFHQQHLAPARRQRERQRGGDRRLAGAALAGDEMQPRLGQARRPADRLGTMSVSHSVWCHHCMLAIADQAPDKLSRMSEPTRWEYATVPLLTHATKQILDQWGEDGWELVSVLPGPTGEQHVAYLKRPK